MGSNRITYATELPLNQIDAQLRSIGFEPSELQNVFYSPRDEPRPLLTPCITYRKGGMELHVIKHEDRHYVWFHDTNFVDVSRKESEEFSTLKNYFSTSS